MVDKIKKVSQAIGLFKSLVVFVHSKPKSSLGTLIAVLVTILVLLFSYKNYIAINQITKSQAEETPDAAKMQILLKQNSENNASFNTILKRLVNLGADRAYVMKFHNGSRDINGVHFMYVSTTNEVTRPGVSNVMGTVQDVPTAIFDPEWINGFLNNKCVEITQTDLDPSNAMNSIMVKVGISRMRICPIYDVEKGYLLGLSGVSWISRLPDEKMDTAVDTELSNVNLALAALLQP